MNERPAGFYFVRSRYDDSWGVMRWHGPGNLWGYAYPHPSERFGAFGDFTDHYFAEIGPAVAIPVGVILPSDPE